MSAPTTITRAWPTTIAWLVSAAACVALLAIVLAMAAGAGNDIMGTVLLGGGALACLRAALVVSGRAPCPGCGARVAPHPTREQLCARCGSLTQRRGGQLHLLADDHVSDRRRFGLMLTGAVQFPAACAHCGRAPTREVEVTYALSFAWKALIVVAAAASGGVGYADQRVRARVPVCDEHDDGGEIKDLDRADVLLFVRSWGFARGFVARNGGKVHLEH